MTGLEDCLCREFPLPRAFPSSFSVRALALFGVLAFPLLSQLSSFAPSKTLLDSENSLSRTMENLQPFVPQVHVKCCLHDTEAVRLVLSSVLLTHCRVKLLEQHIQLFGLVAFLFLHCVQLALPRARLLENELTRNSELNSLTRSLFWVARNPVSANSELNCELN